MDATHSPQSRLAPAPLSTSMRSIPLRLSLPCDVCRRYSTASLPPSVRGGASLAAVGAASKRPRGGRPWPSASWLWAASTERAGAGAGHDESLPARACPDAAGAPTEDGRADSLPDLSKLITVLWRSRGWRCCCCDCDCDCDCDGRGGRSCFLPKLLKLLL